MGGRAPSIIPSTATEEHKWIVSMDVGMMIVMFLNLLCIGVHTHWRGTVALHALDKRDTSEGWAHAELVFALLDHTFNVIFIAELLVRLAVYRCAFFCTGFTNIFDALVVVLTSIEAYIMQPLKVGSSQSFALSRLARAFRIFRIFRVLRVFRYAQKLSELRVLTMTLASSASALFWSVMMLAIIIVAGGVFMAQTLENYIIDSTGEDETRWWVYRHYGNAARATYTLFEATFSGSWPTLARPLIENVSSGFAVFWIIWNVVITFAVLRVIGAIFLSQTIKLANNDAEMLMLEKMREKENFCKKIRCFFAEADTSCDGMLSADEFNAMLANPQVITWLQVLDLEIHEVTELFHLLDNDGDELVSLDEFIGGALRLKGHARATDSIAIMHHQTKLTAYVKNLAAYIAKILEMKHLTPPPEVSMETMELQRRSSRVDNGAMG